MKKILSFIAAMALTVNLCSAAELFCVVRTTDLAGKEHYEIMTYDDFKEHDKTLDNENVSFQKRSC